MLQESDTSSPQDHAHGRIGIVVGKFNNDLTTNLLQACVGRLNELGVDISEDDVYWVPGAFEMPWMARKLAEHEHYDLVIVLGVILKGDTYHFEMIANECARGVMNVMLECHIPVIFEVIACFNRADAEKRCANNQLNKGIEAANAAVEMLQYANHNEE